MRPLILCLALSFPFSALAGCASAHVPAPPPVFQAAVRQAEPSPAVAVTPVPFVPVPAPVPVSARMIVTLPLPAAVPTASGRPLDRVASANKAAVQEPRADGFINAIQVYPYLEGALFRLYTAPDRVTDIALQGGEQLIAISAGDTARWVIGNTHSGAGTDQVVHILVKPQVAGLKTNLVIATDRRTYHLQMESTPATAMAALSWRYPQDELLALQAATRKAEAVAPVADGVALDQLRFGYTVSGASPAWRPVRVFDDGARVYIQFPEGLRTTDAPPLFIAGAGGKAELVNYRVSRNNYYIVDRLFDLAELRLGTKPQIVVRITREGVTGGSHD
jgi:type IV secretion system protein VirB9